MSLVDNDSGITKSKLHDGGGSNQPAKLSKSKQTAAQAQQNTALGNSLSLAEAAIETVIAAVRAGS